MDFSDWFGHLQQKLKDFLEPKEFIEIWKSVLMEIEDRIQTISPTKKVFPYNLIEISILAMNPSQQADWTGIHESMDPSAEVRRFLQEKQCSAPPELHASIMVAGQDENKRWPGDARFQIHCRNVPVASKPETEFVAQLDILNGTANESTFALLKDEICLGRCEVVTDRYGVVTRRNDIYFIDDQSEINASVSQEHGRIVRTPSTGQFFIFDTSYNGTRILRGGRSIQVPHGQNPGVRLQDGDEIHFGKAQVRFRLVESRAAGAANSGANSGSGP